MKFSFMIRIIKILRIISFAVLLITSIALLKAYFTGYEVKFEFITHLHVIFGILFLIIALLMMIKQKH